VSGVHIRDVLCEIDVLQPGLILRFGGHAMAAGGSIAESGFEAFREHWHNVLEQHRREIDAANKILSDGELGPELDDLGFIRTLKHAAPWGQGFPEPLFDNQFTVVNQKIVGHIHLKLVLRSDHDDRVVEAIRFRFLDAPGAPVPEFNRIHAAYRVDINEFAGRINPQLILEYFSPL